MCGIKGVEGEGSVTSEGTATEGGGSLVGVEITEGSGRCALGVDGLAKRMAEREML